MPPKCHIPVTEVRITSPECPSDSPSQDMITNTTQLSQIRAATTLHKTRTLHEVSSSRQCGYEGWNLQRIHRAVRIHHDEDVTIGPGKTGAKSIAFTWSSFNNHSGFRPQSLYNFHCSVRRTAINNDQFVDSRNGG